MLMRLWPSKMLVGNAEAMGLVGATREAIRHLAARGLVVDAADFLLADVNRRVRALDQVIEAGGDDRLVESLDRMSPG